jgi:hypothetical protein
MDWARSEHVLKPAVDNFLLRSNNSTSKKWYEGVPLNYIEFMP